MAEGQGPGKSLAQQLWGAEVLLGADVVYDPPATSALVVLVAQLLRHGRARAFYLAIEKRVYFSTATLRPEVAAYPQFLDDCVSRGLLVEQIDLLEVPVHFDYVRSRFYELVSIK